VVGAEEITLHRVMSKTGGRDCPARRLRFKGPVAAVVRQPDSDGLTRSKMNPFSERTSVVRHFNRWILLNKKNKPGKNKSL